MIFPKIPPKRGQGQVPWHRGWQLITILLMRSLRCTSRPSRSKKLRFSSIPAVPKKGWDVFGCLREKKHRYRFLARLPKKFSDGFFFARWLLIAYSSKNDKKRRFQSKAVRFFFGWVGRRTGFFLGGWGGEQAKICASNDINDKFFLVAATMIWRLKPYDLWGDWIPTPWPCFVFFKDIYIPENQRLFPPKKGSFRLREYGNTGIHLHLNQPSIFKGVWMLMIPQHVGDY